MEDLEKKKKIKEIRKQCSKQSKFGKKLNKQHWNIVKSLAPFSFLRTTDEYLKNFVFNVIKTKSDIDKITELIGEVEKESIQKDVFKKLLDKVGAARSILRRAIDKLNKEGEIEYSDFKDMDFIFLKFNLIEASDLSKKIK